MMKRSPLTVGRNAMWKSTALAILAAILAALVFSGGAYPTKADANPQAYDNVQVLVHTADSFAGTYVISAYNSSGSLVAWSQSRYPASSFELPSSSYLFTANAFQQENYGCYPYPLQAATSGPTTTGAPSNVKTGMMPPCRPYNPKIEYGYSVQQISGPRSLDINTKPLAQSPTSALLLHVRYANGTAASQVSVSAFVVGATNWWGGAAANLTMYAQTGSDGSARLIVPSFPVEVTAWESLPVNLPKNQTTVQTIVAGEKVNVTVYWQPTYVALGASVLVLPPAKGADMTLHFQQPSYWPVPYGIQAGAGVATPAPGTIPGTGAWSAPSGPPQSGMSSQGTLQNTYPQVQPPVQISSFTADGQSSGVSGSDTTAILVIAAAAAALASVSLVIALKRGK